MSLTVRPRYSVRMAALAPSRRSRTSSTTATFSGLGFSKSVHLLRCDRALADGNARTPWITEGFASSGGLLRGLSSPMGAPEVCGEIRLWKSQGTVLQLPRSGRSRSRSQLLVGRLDPGGIDLDARPHRRGDRDRA